jgi:hypothetical protein
VSPIADGSIAQFTVEASEGSHEKLLDKLFRQCWASVTARRDRSADLIAMHQGQSKKIESQREIDRVPRTEEERQLLLRMRPREWEWLLFGSVLFKEKRALEDAWRNAPPRKPFPPGRVLSAQEAVDYLSKALSRSGRIVTHLDQRMSSRAQRRAFGKPGEPGNPGRITKMAEGIVGSYREWLEWADDLRLAPVPRKYGNLFDIASEMADAPIGQIREYIDRTVKELDGVPSAMHEGHGFSLDLVLDLGLDDEVMQRFQDEQIWLQGGRTVRRATPSRSGSGTQPARPPIPESVRHEVWRRDEGRCVDCGSKERLEFDHIIPWSKGGSNTARNLQLRCEPCNRRKGARI